MAEKEPDIIKAGVDAMNRMERDGRKESLHAFIGAAGGIEACRLNALDGRILGGQNYSGITISCHFLLWDLLDPIPMNASLIN